MHGVFEKRLNQLLDSEGYVMNIGMNHHCFNTPMAVNMQRNMIRLVLRIYFL